jgi:hypothetical protein
VTYLVHRPVGRCPPVIGTMFPSSRGSSKYFTAAASSTTQLSVASIVRSISAAVRMFNVAMLGKCVPLFQRPDLPMSVHSSGAAEEAGFPL